MKITFEPAERPFTIALSHDEMIALINFHNAEIKKVPKVLGKLLMQDAPPGVPRRKLMTAYHKEAQELSDAHFRRAKGLLSILKTTAPQAPSSAH